MRSLTRLIDAALLFLAIVIVTAAFAVVVLITGCASASQPDPTPQRPQIACISESSVPQMNPRTGGKVLPEIVRLIGVTSAEDGERWKVVRGLYNADACALDVDGDACGWLPYDRSQIKTGAVCGPESVAMLELQARNR